MKYFTILLLTLFINNHLFAQEIQGQWNGVLDVMGNQLRLILHISKAEDGYTATMDSPDQGAKGIPVTKVTFENQQLDIEISHIRAQYAGKLDGGKIVGKFRQLNQEFPLDFSREVTEVKVSVRPQEPKPPYPYYTEEVTFANKSANITLAGTLTLPKKEGKFPVVILVSGSGPQNRDEEIMGHKPFLVIADYLTRNGIGVLRYDDRGVGKSTGIFSSATTFDFASDVESAVDFLKTQLNVNSKNIGIIGHSEGGIIAPIVASQRKDVKFIVLLAGTGIPGDQLLLLQQEAIARAQGIPETEIQKIVQVNQGVYTIIKDAKTEYLKNDLDKYLRMIYEEKKAVDLPESTNVDELIENQIITLTNPWMSQFIQYNPLTSLSQVKCPTLAIIGEKDLQVPPKVNLPAIKKALDYAGNKNVTTMELPGLNHLFQECETGLPSEYAKIEQTFSPDALKIISDWIHSVIQP